MCILPLIAVCSECVKASLEQTDGSWVAVFSLCSSDHIFNYATDYPQLLCCFLTTRSRKVSCECVVSLKAVNSELLCHPPRRGASIKAPSADERNTTEEEDAESWFICWST